MKIQVTAEHIARGVQSDCEKCPIGLALRDAGLFASVGLDHIEFYSYEHYEHGTTHWGTHLGTRAMPFEVSMFIRRFDDNQRVEPFEFEIDPPQEARVQGSGIQVSEKAKAPAR